MYKYSRRFRKRRKNNWKLLFTFTFVLILLITSLRYLIINNPTSRIVSPLSESIIPIVFNKNFADTIIPQTSDNTSVLIQQIKDLTDNRPEIYSVYIYNLMDDTSSGFNETTIFTAASVNKLPLLAGLYYEAQNQEIDLDRRITIQEKDIVRYGTGSIQNKGPGQIYSLKSLAQILIEKSDNTAASVLTHIVGEDRIQELVDNWGMTQTDIANNKTSNSDIAILLTKMYRGQIANEALTTEMIGFLDDSDFENRLPRLLPNDTQIFHKIGTEVGIIHDVGIIKTPSDVYYLGIMTNDVTDETSTEDTIAKISKLVYDFMKTH